ncbi:MULTISPECIES: hypothetical protein [unclassified Microcoleus]
MLKNIFLAIACIWRYQIKPQVEMAAVKSSLAPQRQTPALVTRQY